MHWHMLSSYNKYLSLNKEVQKVKEEAQGRELRYLFNFTMGIFQGDRSENGGRNKDCNGKELEKGSRERLVSLQGKKRNLLEIICEERQEESKKKKEMRKKTRIETELHKNKWTERG